MPVLCVSFPYLIITLQADLKFGVEQGVDMVFASFIRKAGDVAACREELGEKGKHILIISKVTTPQKLEGRLMFFLFKLTQQEEASICTQDGCD